MDEDRDRDHSSVEALKLAFEFFKHFTTLPTASAVILLALHNSR